jgi:hypothetical protein
MRNWKIAIPVPVTAKSRNRSQLIVFAWDNDGLRSLRVFAWIGGDHVPRAKLQMYAWIHLINLKLRVDCFLI